MIVVDPIDAPCGATVRNIDLSAEITQDAVTVLQILSALPCTLVILAMIPSSIQ